MRKQLTDEQLMEMARRVLGRPRRLLKGEEYDQVSTLIALLEPTRQTNNQHTWTDEYVVGDLLYEVTFLPFEDRPEITVSDNNWKPE